MTPKIEDLKAAARRERDEVAGSLTKARTLFRRAAKAGDPEAMCELADLLGRTEREVIESIALYSRAFARGYKRGAYNLAVTYQNRGEWKLAAKWFAKAVDTGDLSGLIPLSQAQLYGRGCRQDIAAGVASLERLANAREWYRLRGEAMFLLGTMYLSGWPVVRDFRRGIRWLERAVELDYEPARPMLRELH